MKPASAGNIREAELARQRALIRSLIEQHGWSATLSPVENPVRRVRGRLPDNIIPFPIARKGG